MQPQQRRAAGRYTALKSQVRRQVSSAPRPPEHVGAAGRTGHYQHVARPEIFGPVDYHAIFWTKPA
jgi:hypothetical protein